MGFQLPDGFTVAGVHCGIKQTSNIEDLTLFVADKPCVAAGVYTQNQVVAAPVTLDRQRTPSAAIRAIVANSGNANACTGDRGDRDALHMATLAAEAIGADAEQVLVLSTGIIGEHLPMPKISSGIQAAKMKLATDESAVVSAARGLMTTDTRHKLASRRVLCNAGEYQMLGFAKGAAMIGPNMATMLGVILTDAPIAETAAQSLLREAVEVSFNCIRVEGHMSTNDTVLLLSNPAVGQAALEASDVETVSQELGDLCIELAKSIPDDGEGATHLIEIQVAGCRDRRAAHRIGQVIADSALVKTAVAGADPNWGRIVSAAGYADIPFDPATVSLYVNGFLLYENGQPKPFDESVVSESIRSQRNTTIQIDLGQGDGAARIWTCDLTAEYVRLNADYHT